MLKCANENVSLIQAFPSCQQHRALGLGVSYSGAWRSLGDLSPARSAMNALTLT